MGQLYDRADIYDLSFTEQKNEYLKQHYKSLFAGKEIRSILDCSIGSGNLTLALAELSYAVYGSDLSGTMLGRCRENARAKGLELELRECDFRKLSEAWADLKGGFDCVMSTGNSLPHVPNADLAAALGEMDRLLRPGGWLYIDLRNWDQILRLHQRFYTYPPIFAGDTRVNYVQAWDYNPDGTMTFNLLYTFERDCRILQEEIFEEHYYPVARTFLEDELKRLGCKEIRAYPFPCMAKKTAEEMDWYCLLARKPQ